MGIDEEKGIALRGVSEETKERVKCAGEWTGTTAAQEAVSDIAKRGKAFEDRVKEAQNIDAQPLYRVNLWS